jgi:hypothetical protein
MSRHTIRTLEFYYQFGGPLTGPPYFTATVSPAVLAKLPAWITRS